MLLNRYEIAHKEAMHEPLLIVAHTPDSAWQKFCTQRFRDLMPNKAEYTVTVVDPIDTASRGATKKRTKLVQYAYASSPNAVTFGFAKTGCWSVEILEGGCPPSPIAGFGTKEQAMEYADTLDYEYDYWQFRKPVFPK